MELPEVKALLESGSALIVGFAHADGRPHATRAWGMTFDPDDGSRAVVLMRPVDLEPLGLGVGDRPHAAIAITGVDVRLLVSAQVKGTLVAVEPAELADVARMHEYCTEFIRAVCETDGFPWELMERWRPDEVVRCRLELTEVFVQTPGPGAGASLGSVAS